jgi:predicted nucleic acid-binding protein
VTTRVFVDTSALYAVLASDDWDHIVAASRWHAPFDQVRLDPTLAVTHSAVVPEVAALVQRRLGMAALRDLST